VLFSFWVCYLLISFGDRQAHALIWKEITEDQNVALALVVGAMSLGICIIIAASITVEEQ
jgi:uncharacterized membrane protein YjfL (UPF0719 family)